MKKYFKINNYTYCFFLLCLLCGYLKNISIIFCICLIHELGHIFFIKIFRYEIINVEILPFGCFTTTNKLVNSSINKDLLINLGGILIQLLLMIFLYLIRFNINPITYNLYIKYNIIIIIFNLIPIIPLDGNNILHLILEKYFSFKNSYYLNVYLSFLFLIIFIIINYVYHIDNYFIISFLIYKLVMYLKNYKYISNRFLIERYIYDIEYKKIDNKTNDLKDLKKEVLHYFKENNKYIKEKEKIEKYLSSFKK